MIGKKVYELLQRKDIASKYIDSDSSNQSDIAKKWNDSTLEVLITTTLGLVGNENKKTQMICIVGLLYNLPSIVQEATVELDLKKGAKKVSVPYIL